jgi:hypothetical protein
MYDDDDDLIDGVGFADPGGRSALRASWGDRGYCGHCRKRVGRKDAYCRHCGGHLNARRHDCPTCGAKDVLTDLDVFRKYQCNRCADRAEGLGYGRDY